MEKHTEITADEAFSLYYKSIYNYILSHLRGDSYLAEDIASDVFAILYHKWESIRPKTNAVIAAWLFETARNVLRNHHHAHTRAPIILSLDDMVDLICPEEDNAAAQVANDLNYHRLLQQLRASLSARDRAFFDAMYIEELSVTALAQRFNIKPEQVYVRRSRLNRRLRTIISKKFQKK
ncbi:MAG: sigma-70 family RNA polymerase sigma factor [Clostridia bacterium]|nr:sigma-70 family RNA polymerase sigma factor [Clostridia bacterium]